jgi:hypothetical protein
MIRSTSVWTSQIPDGYPTAERLKTAATSLLGSSSEVEWRPGALLSLDDYGSENKAARWLPSGIWQRVEAAHGC